VDTLELDVRDRLLSRIQESMKEETDE
jgi:hypothetical protein